MVVRGLIRTAPGSSDSVSAESVFAPSKLTDSASQSSSGRPRSRRRRSAVASSTIAFECAAVNRVVCRRPRRTPTNVVASCSIHPALAASATAPRQNCRLLSRRAASSAATRPRSPARPSTRGYGAQCMSGAPRRRVAVTASVILELSSFVGTPVSMPSASKESAKTTPGCDVSSVVSRPRCRAQCPSCGQCAVPACTSLRIVAVHQRFRRALYSRSRPAPPVGVGARRVPHLESASCRRLRNPTPMNGSPVSPSSESCATSASSLP